MLDKPKLLIYSDTYIYGGNDRLMSFLIRNAIVNSQYQIKYVYRKHKIFQEGLDKELNNYEFKELLVPVWITSNDTLFYKIGLKKIPKYLKIIWKLPFLIFDKIGIYFLYNLLLQIIILKKMKPNLIHINNGGYPGAGSCSTMVVAAKIMKIDKIVYQVNNVALKHSGLFDRVYDVYINKNVSVFLTASQNAKLKLANNRNFDFDKIIQVPNTVLEEEITFSGNEIRNSLSIKKDDLLICSVGFLSKRKGQQYLLDALKKIKILGDNIFENIKLIIVGDGEEEFHLKSFSKNSGLNENVFFLGYKANSIDYINACDIFIAPSISNEDMPLVVLSAMSKGRIIIATDFAGIQEEIENGVSGILVSPNIETLSSDIANAIINLFYKRNNSLGENAKKRYYELFSNVVYGNSIIKIYKSLMKENKGDI